MEIRDVERTITMKLCGKKVIKKYSSGERYFKKKGAHLLEFAHVTNKDKPIRRCCRDNLSPTNPVQLHIFDLLKNLKNNTPCKESIDYDDKIK